MKKTLIATLMLAGASAAFAQSEAPITREDVLAELRLMRASGELEQRHHSEDAAIFLRDVDASPADEAKTRAEVRQELLDARADGSLAALNSENSHAWEHWVPRG